MWLKWVFCNCLAAQGYQAEERCGQVQKGQGSRQQIWRQSEEEGNLNTTVKRILHIIRNISILFKSLTVTLCMQGLTFPLFLYLSRSGPKERWGTSWTTWSSLTRSVMTNCTKKFPTTSSSHPLWSLRGWRSGARLPGLPCRSCSAKVIIWCSNSEYDWFTNWVHLSFLSAKPLIHKLFT